VTWHIMISVLKSSPVHGIAGGGGASGIFRPHAFNEHCDFCPFKCFVLFVHSVQLALTY
jgi:hypothetical protein